MGVLYMTSADPEFFTKATIPIAKMFLRALAAEMLGWWINKVRTDLLRETDLKPEEIDLIKLVHQGHKTKEIARMTKVSPAAVDQRISRIAMRLNAPNRSIAAKLAFENGLLEPHK